jgi:hypothetical protein
MVSHGKLACPKSPKLAPCWPLIPSIRTSGCGDSENHGLEAKILYFGRVFPKSLICFCLLRQSIGTSGCGDSEDRAPGGRIPRDRFQNGAREARRQPTKMAKSATWKRKSAKVQILHCQRIHGLSLARVLRSQFGARICHSDNQRMKRLGTKFVRATFQDSRILHL